MRIVVSRDNNPNNTNNNAPNNRNNINNENIIIVNNRQNNNNNNRVVPQNNNNANNANNVNKKSKKERDGDDEGYNSEDEYSSNSKKKSYAEYLEMEKNLVEFVKSKGYEIYAVKEDGNCLFRAVSHQIYGDEEMHDQVRLNCTNYMSQERDHYSQYITEDFDEYIKRKKEDKSFGNNVEIQAISEIYNRPVEVYSSDSLVNIFHSEFNASVPIRLSYHNLNHYNSVVDPNNPTVGLGLGLPSFEPGLADKLQVEKAIDESEIEIVESLISKESEMEQVEKEIEKSIIEASINEFTSSTIENEGDLDEEIEKAVMEESMRDYWNSIAQSVLKGIDFSVVNVNFNNNSS